MGIYFYIHRPQANSIKLQASQFVLGTGAQGVLTTALKEVTEDIGLENFWRRCPPGCPNDKHKADILAICCKKFKVHLKIPVAADVKKKKTSAVFLHVNTFLTVPDPGGATFSLSQSRATDPLEKSTQTVYRRYFFLHCFPAFYIIHLVFGPHLLLLLLSASVWYFNNVTVLDHF